MEEGSSLLQKMRHVFSDNEDKEKIAEEIIDKIEEGFQKGVIGKRETQMICNIFGYMDTDAKDIMTHRKHIVALNGEATLSEALGIILEENNSRFPIYEEDIDNIIGMIHLRDAMKCYFNESLRNVPIKELKAYIRPVSFIPETRSIDKLFLQMQKAKKHMAIVIDEYGQTSGLVTMEDIIEEVVGNIQDEYDEEEELIIPQSDGTYLIDGMAELEDLEELLDVDFEEEDYDTINGYLVNQLDRIPAEDEKCTVEVGEYQFEVLMVDKKMIRKIRVKKNH